MIKGKHCIKISCAKTVTIKGLFLYISALKPDTKIGLTERI